MGQRLTQYFEFANQKGGMAMQMKLAMKTHMAGPDAEKAPDTPDNIEKFRKVLSDLMPGVSIP